MKLASCLLALALATTFPSLLRASESATDCRTATETLQAGLEAQPENMLSLFVDALQTNPGCRRNLLITAMEFSNGRPQEMEKIIFVARQEFPGEQSMLAEAALSAAPDYAEVIRKAFMTGTDEIRVALSEQEEPSIPGLVAMPPESQELDDDIREAIARMAAKVEGKHWPEQDLGGGTLTFRTPDDVRVSRKSYLADETSLENAIPIDTVDEREISKPQLRINDHWEPEKRIELDESKFEKGNSENASLLKEARKREIAPAGAVGFPKRPILGKSSVYYIPPANGDYLSTVDQDDRPRPPLVIRPASSFRSVPPSPEELKEEK